MRFNRIQLTHSTVLLLVSHDAYVRILKRGLHARHAN